MAPFLDAMLAEVGHLRRTPKIPTPSAPLRHKAPRPRHLLLYPLPLAENPHVRSGGTTDRHLLESCDIIWMEPRKTLDLDNRANDQCWQSRGVERSAVRESQSSPLLSKHSGRQKVARSGKHRIALAGPVTISTSISMMLSSRTGAAGKSRYQCRRDETAQPSVAHVDSILERQQLCVLAVHIKTPRPGLDHDRTSGLPEIEVCPSATAQRAHSPPCPLPVPPTMTKSDAPHLPTFAWLHAKGYMATSSSLSHSGNNEILLWSMVGVMHQPCDIRCMDSPGFQKTGFADERKVASRSRRQTVRRSRDTNANWGLQIISMPDLTIQKPCKA